MWAAHSSRAVTEDRVTIGFSQSSARKRDTCEPDGVAVTLDVDFAQHLNRIVRPSRQEMYVDPRGHRSQTGQSQRQPLPHLASILRN